MTTLYHTGHRPSSGSTTPITAAASIVTPHGWGPAYVPDSSDTLEQVLAHLDGMVEDGILTAEERAHSEAFYKHLFHLNTSQHDPYNGETPIGIMLDGGYSEID